MRDCAMNRALLIGVFLTGVRMAALGLTLENIPPSVVSADFRSSADTSRADFEADVAFDLFATEGLEFDICVDDILAFGHFSIYLQSGNGYYCTSFPLEGDGWERVRLTRQSLMAKHEGEPEGPDRISRIKITGWRGENRRSSFRVRNFSGLKSQPSAEGVRESGFAHLAELPGRADERRFVWIHNPLGRRRRGDWDEQARQLAEAGFTDLIVNFCWAATAAYPSRFLDPMKEYSRYSKGFADCQAACRKHGLRLHAWKVAWCVGSWTADDAVVCRYRDAGRCMVGHDGKAPDEIAWLCPTDPRNRRQQVESVVELAKKGVDGVHLDFIRYSDENSCFCDRCAAAFEKAWGKPLPADWKMFAWGFDKTKQDVELKAAWNRFRCAMMTECVREIGLRLRTDCPGVAFSVAPFGDVDKCAESVGQDWATWVNGSMVDFACPMTYWTSTRVYEKNLRTILGSVDAPERLMPGIGFSCWPKDGREFGRVARQLEIVRKLGFAGCAFFEYDEPMEALLPALRKGAFRVVR